MDRANQSVSRVNANRDPVFDLVLPHTLRIREQPSLRALGDGGLTPESWTRFAVERYHAAHSFIPLLERTIELASEILCDSHLSTVLRENLNDELGLNRPELGSHEKWRQDFYSALGAGPELLKKGPTLPSTKTYAGVIDHLIAESDPLVAIGALTALEGTIPCEFNLVLRGCERDFPGQFAIRSEDSVETLAQKEKTRLYLADHIEHDMNGHFADLCRALRQYALDTEARPRLATGMHEVMTARFNFWSELGSLLTHRQC